MRLVVADTAPLNYLVLIDQVELLSILFERVFVPDLVRNELQHIEAPDAVRRWIAAPPRWVEVVASSVPIDAPDLRTLDDEERAAAQG